MKTVKPLVSVVTISYNHERYIEQALDSIIGQVGSNYNLEVIVADDASSDSTRAIIEKYHQEYPDIIKPILRRKNIGIQNNLIDALQSARGKYIALCEGDDYWTDTGKLARQVELLESNPSMNICFHPTRVFFEDKSYPDTKYPAGRTNFTPQHLMSENFIPTNSVVYRRLNYDALRNDLMPFDWYLHGYHLQGGGIGFINKKMSAYRRHKGGAWWSSHGNAKEFWTIFGPKMVDVLEEFRSLYGKSAVMLEGIGKGEFRIINEMMHYSAGVDQLFKNRRLAIDYAFNSSHFIGDYYRNKRRIELTLKNKAEELRLANDQLSAEAALLRRDLGEYKKSLADTQRDYDLLRKDLKNPLRLIERITRRIFSK